MKGLAQAMIEEANAPVIITIPLKTDSPPYSVYGAGFIEEGARNQMDIAMKLPVTLGAGLDEAPMAYKDINMVMNAQQDLECDSKVPSKVIRMAHDGSRED